jgi:mRNA-degrading endonuclease RelE of RelBE toxin-antitoxin system
MGNGKGIARHELKVQYRVIYKVEDQRILVIVRGT